MVGLVLLRENYDFCDLQIGILNARIGQNSLLSFENVWLWDANHTISIIWFMGIFHTLLLFLRLIRSQLLAIRNSKKSIRDITNRNLMFENAQGKYFMKFSFSSNLNFDRSYCSSDNPDWQILKRQKNWIQKVDEVNGINLVCATYNLKL